MYKRLATIFGFLFATIVSVAPQQIRSENDFDLLIFTQNWPITACLDWEHENPSHACSMPKNIDSWSIHGIWPTRLGSEGPQFCNRSWQFDPEQIKPIEDDLSEKWCGVHRGQGVYDFWAHEWSKHGTCAAVLIQFNSEFNYFTNGLRWLSKYYMNDVLSGAGINPSNDNTYSLEKINNAIKSNFLVDPVIECRNYNGQDYLIELRLCLSKSLELVNCDGVHDSEVTVNGEKILSNCHGKSGILYPQDLPQQDSVYSVYVQLYKLITWLQWLTL